MIYFNQADVIKLYNFLGFSSENIAECRCIDVTKPDGLLNRSFINGELEFVQWARLWNGRGNCFVGRNARKAIDSKEIKQISCISLDLDPIREKGTAATNEQTKECVDAGNIILDRFSGGALALSGNGVLLMWVCDKPVMSEFKTFETKIKAFQDECSELIKSAYKGVRIDATQDSPRLVKLLGTVSVKGGMRATRFLRVPNSRGDGDAVFERVGHLGGVVSVPQETLLAKSNYPSRSEADYALASHYRQSGLGPDACLTALQKHALGRNDRHDDHKRIIEKVYGQLGLQVASNGIADYRAHDIVLHSPGTSLDDYLGKLQKRGEKDDSAELPTGFEKFDRATNGLRRSEVYTVAARPAVGKSSYLLNMADYLCSLGKRVLLLSTEMPYYSIWDRLFSIGAEIDGQKFNTGKFSDEENQRKNKFYEKFKDYKFHVCDMFQPDIISVQTAVKKITPDVLMFDHIQHIGGNNMNEVKSISDFTRGLKQLAMEINCAVVVASQLRRPLQAMNFRTGGVMHGKPSMADLKGCGTIEEESAFVLLLYNSGASLDDNVPIVTGELAKNRFGPNVVDDLAFYKNMTKFKPVGGGTVGK